jgi:zinc protease
MTTLAARVVPKGTATRTAAQIAEAAELLGGSIGSSVGKESFGWSISVPTDNVSAALWLLSDVVQHATLADAAIETERAALLSGIAQLRDDMYQYPMRLLREAAFAEHPYGQPTSGTEASVRAMTGDDVRTWYTSRLRRAPFVAAIVGAVDADAMAAEVASAFSELTPDTSGARGTMGVAAVAAPAWPPQVVQRAESRDKAQTAIAMAFAGPNRHDPLRMAAHVVSTIASGLGGRFFDELRDRQSLAYTVHAFAAELQRVGLFCAYIATSPGREDVARDGLLREFAKLRDVPVSDDELARAKRYILGMHDIRQERGGAVLSDVVEAWVLGAGLSELQQFVPNVQRVTASDILTLAQTYFDPNRRAEGIVRGTERAV